MKRKILILSIAVALIGIFTAGIIGVNHWSYLRELSAYQATYDSAVYLLDSGNSAEALSLLNRSFNPALEKDVLNQWPPLMVKAALESKNYIQLEHLIRQYPAIMIRDESAALWWVRVQMHRRLWSTTEQVMNYWPLEKQNSPHRWLLLEADHYLLSGEIEKAQQLLRSWKGEGNDESNRQMRLALLSGTNLDAIMVALKGAYNASPRSAEVRATEAQFLERSGSPVLARREYIAAFLLEPKNPFYGDQLAEFYRRSYSLAQAIDTWRQTFQQTGDPRSWWKCWFWERVVKQRGEALDTPSGDWWANLPEELALTSDNAFLDSAFLADHPQPPAILTNDEAYYWLVALEYIRIGEEAMALEVLETMPEASPPIASDLHSLIVALLEWRVRGEWPRDVVISFSPRNHRYFQFLGNYRPEHRADDLNNLNSIEKFLASQSAVGSLLLANGWLGAADRIMPEESLVKAELTDPQLNWLPFAYTKMKSSLYGYKAGITASELFPEDTAVGGLSAELMLLDGRVEQGLESLERLKSISGGVGYRASYLLAMAELERENFLKFNQLISERQDLAQSVSGMELMARAALAQNNTTEAYRIYNSLRNESVEGCVYRFRVARDQADFKAAGEILDVLLQLSPNEPIFHQWFRELNADND